MIRLTVLFFVFSSLSCSHQGFELEQMSEDCIKNKRGVEITIETLEEKK